MSKPSVSIVIPVLNRASLLPRLFSSLKGVTYRPLEVVLVDNGSTDDSLSLCERFAQTSGLQVTVVQEQRKGANQARNCGLRHCRTEWVYFFDSDDELSPDFLDMLMPKATDADLIVFPTQMEIGGKLHTRDFIPSPSVAQQILSATLNTQGMILRADFLRNSGAWNEDLAVWQDWELGVRLLSRSPKVASYKDRAFHVLHQHVESITASASVHDRAKTLLAVVPLLSSAAEHRALYFRCAIFNGQNKADVQLPVRVSPLAKAEGWLLRLYCRLGGRGAWRLALLFS